MVIYPFIHIGHCFVCSSSQYHSPSMSKIHSIPVLFEGSLVVNNGDICGGGSLFCSPFWESFVVWGSFAVRDHLWYCTVLNSRQTGFWPGTMILVLGLQMDLTRGLVLSVVQWYTESSCPLPHTSPFSLYTAGPSSVLSALLSASIVNTNFFLPLSLSLL